MGIQIKFPSTIQAVKLHHNLPDEVGLLANVEEDKLTVAIPFMISLNHIVQLTCCTGTYYFMECHAACSSVLAGVTNTLVCY